VQNAQAQSSSNKPPQVDAPAGYNILFVLVDQEHFFNKWPIPVPAREAIKKKAITFLNHQNKLIGLGRTFESCWAGQRPSHNYLI
jgi:hypothetical protein